MTSAVVRMVRDTIGRVRHVSPAGARQEAVALVKQLQHADREVLRVWVRAIASALGPASAPASAPASSRDVASASARERCAESRHTIAGVDERCMCGVFSLGGGS